MKIAVVGSGIAGLGCAHLLGPHHDVTLFEAANRLGGHANTVAVDDPHSGRLAIDTGFIVHNDRNYPNFVRLLAELGVPTQESEMSFGVHDKATGFAYRASSLDTLLANRRNVLRPSWWRMLADIPRFWRAARKFIESGDEDVSLQDFLDEHHYSAAFVDLHLIPMGAAIWSADPDRFAEFPAAALFGFLQNHGLLGLADRPQWRTVVGGSRRYVEAIADRFDGTIRTATPVESVARVSNGIDLVAAGSRECFDRVVLACHTDQALELLVDATPEEKDMLSAIGYQPNRATLHTDESVLPRQQRARAAWNYEIVPGTRSATLTYDLTTLQRLPGSRRYLVSLNLDHRIDPAQVIERFTYEHPILDRAAMVAQREPILATGSAGVSFCGAWAGHGFHEDGLVAAIRVCRELGVTW